MAQQKPTLQPAAAVAAPKIPWNPLLAVTLVVLVYFTAQLLSGLILSLYPLARHWSHAHTDAWFKNSTSSQFWFTLLFEAMTAAAIYMFVSYYKRRLSLIGLKRPRWRDLGVGLLGFAVYFVVFAVAITVLGHFIPAINAHQDQDVGFNSVHGSSQLVLTFFSLVIFPPIVEELTFRGLIFGSLRKNLNFYYAALGTSLLFALPHLFESGNGGLLYIGGIDTLVLSAVACYMREKTDSLIPGMLLHALKNFVAFYSLYILGGK